MNWMGRRRMETLLKRNRKLLRKRRTQLKTHKSESKEESKEDMSIDVMPVSTPEKVKKPVKVNTYAPNKGYTIEEIPRHNQAYSQAQVSSYENSS